MPANVFNLLNALEKLLPEHGYETAKGAGTGAAAARLAEEPSPLY